MKNNNTKKDTLMGIKLLNIDQAAATINYKKSYIYKMVHLRLIPVHKSPGGRKLVFIESEIIEWAVARTLLTVDELAQTL